MKKFVQTGRLSVKFGNYKDFFRIVFIEGGEEKYKLVLKTDDARDFAETILSRVQLAEIEYEKENEK